MASAKTKLSRLLAAPPKVTRLTRAVESKLGIMRMVTIRRIQPPKHWRARGGKPKENQINPLISRVVRDGYEVAVDGKRGQAFRDAIRRVLGETEPDAETRRLQSDIRPGLNAPPEARRNRRRQGSVRPPMGLTKW